MNRSLRVGWHGKLPSRADFVSGGSGTALIEGWRSWATRGVAIIKEAPASRTAFLVAPIWRFACSPGFFGPAGGIGVMSPGADRLGRLFPFLVAAEDGDLSDPDEALATAESWFEATEPAVLAALDPDFDPLLLERKFPPLPALEQTKNSERSVCATFVASRQARHLRVRETPGSELFTALFGPAQPVTEEAERPGSPP